MFNSFFLKKPENQQYTDYNALQVGSPTSNHPDPDSTQPQKIKTAFKNLSASLEQDPNRAKRISTYLTIFFFCLLILFLMVEAPLALQVISLLCFAACWVTRYHFSSQERKRMDTIRNDETYNTSSSLNPQLPEINSQHTIKEIDDNQSNSIREPHQKSSNF